MNLFKLKKKKLIYNFEGILLNVKAKNIILEWNKWELKDILKDELLNFSLLELIIKVQFY